MAACSAPDPTPLRVKTSARASREQGVRSRVGAAVAGALTTVLLASIVASAGAQPFDQPDRVLVSTTGNHSELVTTVPIGTAPTAPGQGGTVVMSLPPESLDPLGGLGDLNLGDGLNASSEVEVTTDCQILLPRCIGYPDTPHPYTYEPTVESRLVLASSEKDTDGTLLASPDERTCTHQQHHCVVVFPAPASPFEVDASTAPCAPRCHVNLVLSAYNAAAHAGDVLIVGADEPDCCGIVVGDKGRVNAVRLRPDVGPDPTEPVTTSSTDLPRVTRVPVEEHLADAKTAVFSLRLDGLRKDEQLAVSADMTTDISRLTYARVLVHSRLILAGRKDATGPGTVVRRVADLNGEITEANGFNCIKADNAPCLTEKVGVGHLIEDARQSGKQVPLYVNLVVNSTAAGGQVQAGDTIKVTGGTLEVVRYPASRHG
jgi:hypothetical protein